ncbi:Imm1 family immunity protein [Saccharothrix xinjiangensis]|uniref:Imm1 family immunity protein n=1 Tax=Saccharothrix xinjiangensis TaxID=204798 RepID=A0ABV9XYK6_9PSEU
MNAALNIWYYRDDDHGTADQPRLVTTPEGLDQVLDHILDHPQPHPPVITVRDRPRLMNGRYPDHEIKIDADRHAGIGAILCSGPPDFAPEATTPDEHGGAWITLAQTTLPEDAPALYMDKATTTAFPHNAVVPLETWRKALHELLHTGTRPTCVQWQDTDLF